MMRMSALLQLQADIKATLIMYGETSLSRFGDDHKAQFEGRMPVLYASNCCILSRRSAVSAQYGQNSACGY
jgi:hypothetical protein